jgi:uncharacterized protein (TIGR02145 family)
LKQAFINNEFDSNYSLNKKSYLYKNIHFMIQPIRPFAILSTCLILTSCGNGVADKPANTNTVAGDTSMQEEATTPQQASEPAIPTIKIGEQEWMLADINATAYNNGDAIPEVTTEKQWTGYASKKEGCYKKLTNGAVLYNGFAMSDARGIVPAGFQIPTQDDFKQLIKFLGGGNSQSGKATKAMAGYTYKMEEWVDGKDGGGFTDVTIKGTGSNGFNAQEGGHIYDNGAANEGSCSYWWTSTKEGKDYAVVDIGYCSQDLGGGSGIYSAAYGFAVRAIKK